VRADGSRVEGGLTFYKGELLVPAAIDYPESKFGGFLATPDYRDAFIKDEMEANGWAIWPPIRFSYRTPDNALPGSAATPPFWLMSPEQRCQRYPLGVNDPECHLGNWHWLGTDNNGHDVMARLDSLYLARQGTDARYARL